MNFDIGYLFGIIFTVVGFLLIFCKIIKNIRCTVETTGTVVDIETEEKVEFEDGRRRIIRMYYPIIEYKAGDKVITKKHNVAYNSPQFHEDETIAILYNPNKVEEYIISGDKSYILFGVIFMAMGILIVLIS